MDVAVNYWAVLVGAIVSYVIGAVWYSKALFAKQWMRAINHNPDSGNKGGMATGMVGMFVTLLVQGYILAHFVSYVGAVTMSDALKLAFWVWLGFIAMFALTSVFFERKSMNWFWIVTGYQFVSLAVMAIVLVRMM